VRRQRLGIDATALGQHERARRLEHTVETLEHGVVGERHFVDEQHVAAAHRIDQAGRRYH